MADDDSLPASTSAPAANPFAVLLFTKTAPGSYRHGSIPAAIAGLKRVAARSGRFSIHATEDDEAITADSLAQFATVVFLHNIDAFLSPAQLAALQAYVRSGGGGFVGVHSASAAMLDDAWYGALVGAHFDFHPEAQWGVLRIEEPAHYIVAGGVGEEEEEEEEGRGAVEPVRTKRWFDEWYNLKTNPRASVRVLLSVEEGSYGGTLTRPTRMRGLWASSSEPFCGRQRPRPHEIPSTSQPPLL
jgi:cytochrome c